VKLAASIAVLFNASRQRRELPAKASMARHVRNALRTTSYRRDVRMPANPPGTLIPFPAMHRMAGAFPSRLQAIFTRPLYHASPECATRRATVG